MISLPELAQLAVKARLGTSHDDYRIACSDIDCNTCIMRTTFDDNWCIFWHSGFGQSFQKTTLIPYLRQHHPEFFI